MSRLAIRDDRTLFLFIFRDEYLPGHVSSPAGDPKSALTEVFADVGWECPRILEVMSSVTEIYFDSVSQIRLERWTKGRAALVGDAAACVSLLAGEGTGLAMAEAYVLAQALRGSDRDYETAFKRYEDCLMPFLKRKQESAARLASSFVPKTAFGISFRNGVTRCLRIPMVADLFIGRDLRDDFNSADCGF